MTKKENILASISPNEALAVLNELTKDPQIRKRAEALALAVVGDVGIDTVAEEVFYELDSIAVEDVWDNSGATRAEYVEPEYVMSGKRGTRIRKTSQKSRSSWILSVVERLPDTQVENGEIGTATIKNR